MNNKIFLTGASGAVGHYVFNELIQNPDYHLYLLVRDPKKLRFQPELYPNLTIIQDDLSHIETHASLLKEMDYIIHIATAWGWGRTAYEIDHDKTLMLFNLVDPNKCKKIIYFSTASILDSNNQPMEAAEQYGIEYIQAKYRTLMDLPSLGVYPKIITLFPTIIFGGDKRHPYTQPSLGILEIKKWLNILRFITIDGSFHFIHAKDIAQIVNYLISHETTESHFVLGNDPISVTQAIQALCRFFQKKIWFQIPIPPILIKVVSGILGRKLLAWDKFCLEYRHFRYKTVNAKTFGIPSHLTTLDDILKEFASSQVKEISGSPLIAPTK